MSVNQIEKGRRSGGAIGGAMYLTVSTLIVKILGLIYKIPLSAILGDEGMGYFNSAYTIYALFYLLCTAGVPKAITMMIVNGGQGRGHSPRAVTGIAMRVFLALGIVLTLLFILLAEPLSVFIGNSDAKYTMLAIAPSIVFISLTGVIRGYLNARLNLIHVAISQIIEAVSRLVLGLVFAHYSAGAGLSPVYISAFTILGVTVGSFLSFGYLMVFTNLNYGSDKTRQKFSFADSKSIMKGILFISLPITLSSMVMSLGNLVDLSLIMRRLADIGYTESQASGMYGNYTTLAVPMYNFVIALITPLSIAYLPVFAGARGHGELQSSLKDALNITALISAPMLVGLYEYSSEILSMIFGAGETAVGAPLLRLLIPAGFLMSLLLIVNSLLESLGSVKAPLYAMLLGGIVKLAVSYFLLANPSYGISAAPISTVFSYGLSLMIGVIYLYVKHRHTLPFITTHIVPYLNAFLAVYVSRLLYNRMILEMSEGLTLVATILFCGVIYLIISVFTGTLSRKKLANIAKYTKLAE